MNKDSFTPILLIAGGFLALKVFGAVSEGVDRVTDAFLPKNLDSVDEARKDTDRLLKAGFTPTYSMASYGGMADSLENAFKSGPFGIVEDEDEILRVFHRMHNDLDVSLLVEAFGVRTFVLPGNSGNLIDWISKWTPELKPEINSVFTQRNISYSF